MHQPHGVLLHAVQVQSHAVVLHEPLFVCSSLISEVPHNQALQPFDVFMPSCTTQNVLSHCHSGSRGGGGGGVVVVLRIRKLFPTDRNANLVSPLAQSLPCYMLLSHCGRLKSHPLAEFCQEQPDMGVVFCQHLGLKAFHRARHMLELKAS